MRTKNLFNRKKSDLDKNKGFTLVEFLIYIGIFSIFLLITLEMFSSIFDIQLESESTSSVSVDGKFILQRFTYDVNRATNISDPNLYGTSSASLTILVDGQNLIYRMDSGNLILENETTGSTDQLNSSESSISDLTFVKLDGGGKDTVQVTFTLTSKIKKTGGEEVEVFQTSAGLR